VRGGGQVFLGVADTSFHRDFAYADARYNSLIIFPLSARMYVKSHSIAETSSENRVRLTKILFARSDTIEDLASFIVHFDHRVTESQTGRLGIVRFSLHSRLSQIPQPEGWGSFIPAYKGGSSESPESLNLPVGGSKSVAATSRCRLE
jgi:hypothetical protein